MYIFDENRELLSVKLFVFRVSFEQKQMDLFQSLY